MMNKQTEALRMAKQHIIERKGGRGGAVCYVKTDKDIIKAIDEALEQPAQSDEYTEGYQQGYIEGWEAKKAEQPARLVSYAPDGSTCTLNIDGEEVYFNREQPAQEPVAWMHRHAGEITEFNDFQSCQYCEPLYTHPAPQPAQEPVARIEVFNLLTKNGAFAIKEEWLWNVRYVNSKGLIKHFPNEYPSEKKYAVKSAKYWADFLNCQIAEIDNRSSK